MLRISKTATENQPTNQTEGRLSTVKRFEEGTEIT
jgi:hypothetical protein